MLTPREKEEKTISVYATVVQLTYWGASFKEVKFFLELNNIPFKPTTIATFYYRARNGVRGITNKDHYLPPSIKPALLKILRKLYEQSLEAGKEAYQDGHRIKIQGDYSASIN